MLKIGDETLDSVAKRATLDKYHTYGVVVDKTTSLKMPQDFNNIH